MDGTAFKEMKIDYLGLFFLPIHVVFALTRKTEDPSLPTLTSLCTH